MQTESEHTAMRVAQTVNRERLEEIFGDDIETIEMIMGVFIDSAQSTMNELEQAIVSQDFKQIKSLGHMIAGSSANIGLERMYEIGRALELASLEEDTSKVRGLYESSLEALDDVVEYNKNLHGNVS